MFNGPLKLMFKLHFMLFFNPLSSLFKIPRIILSPESLQTIGLLDHVNNFEFLLARDLNLQSKMEIMLYFNVKKKGFNLAVTEEK